jgi:hypothetical protein
LSKLKNRWLDVLGLAVGLLLMLSCSDGDSPTDPGPQIDSVAVESITPAAGESLLAGSRVTFRARVRYTLATASSGQISIIVEDQSSRNISSTRPQPSAQVQRGSGTVELADTIDVPANGVTRVDVFLPLFPAGASSTSTVQVVRYPVL